MPYYISVKEPRIETSGDYNPFLAKLGADTTYSFQIKHDYRDSVNKSPYALYNYKLEKGYPQSSTQIIIFDSTGNLYFGYDTCFGIDKFDELFDSVPFNKNEEEFNYLMNQEMNLEGHLNLLPMSISEKKNIFQQIKKHEYTVFIHYVKYNGLIINKMVKSYNQHIDKHKVGALTIYMNMATRDSV